MDIHVSDLGAARLAVGQIFGDDISTGPRRAMPDWLLPYASGAGYAPVTIDLGPAELAGARPIEALMHGLETWSLLVHRVKVRAPGQYVGDAWRMDDQSLKALASFEAAIARRGGSL